MAPLGQATTTTRRSAGWPCALVAVALGLALFSPAQAQAPPAGVTYSRNTNFYIPFVPEGGSRNLRQVHLYVSIDQGRTWRQSSSAPPEQRRFEFRAERDGLYWFTVQTVDN